MIAGGLKGHIGIEDMERRALAGGEGAYTDLVDEELPPLERVYARVRSNEEEVRGAKIVEWGWRDLQLALLAGFISRPDVYAHGATEVQDRGEAAVLLDEACRPGADPSRPGITFEPSTASEKGRANPNCTMSN